MRTFDSIFETRYSRSGRLPRGGRIFIAPPAPARRAQPVLALLRLLEACLRHHPSPELHAQ